MKPMGALPVQSLAGDKPARLRISRCWEVAE
jgi:hypothetical protein